MKRFVNFFIIFCILCNSVFADCDWTQIKKNPDNTYTYSKELHLCVGNLVQSSKVKDQQISDLTKAITLKDLALQDSDARVQLWSKTSADLEARLQKVDSLQSSNQWLYFLLGVGTTFAAGMAAAKLAGH